MVPDTAPLVAVVFVLGSLAYFEMASIPFLFVRLDNPDVWRLFRGLFNTYFPVIGVVCLAAAIAFATSGPLMFAGVMLALSALVTVARGRVLQRIDAQQSAGRSGDPRALRQLRITHWGAMAVNVAFLAFVAGCLPFLF